MSFVIPKSTFTRASRHGRLTFVLALVCGAVLALSSPTARAQSPHERFVQLLASAMPRAGSTAPPDWRTIESVRAIRWAPLPPQMLDDALPDGSYFRRAGAATIEGRNVAVLATGARTMVGQFYFRNQGAPLGESGVLDAFKRFGIEATLARCPIAPSAAAGDKWWRLKGGGKAPAVLQLQTNCNGAKCESFALLLGENLPSMTPAQQRQYSDRCAGGAAASGAGRPAAAAWDEQLAELFIALMPAPGNAPVPWSALQKAADVRWEALPPKMITAQPPWPDNNRHYRPGSLDLGGRTFYLTATGDANAVGNVHVEDATTVANRGDVFKVFQRKGYVVQLARCGRVYQLSSQQWFRVAAPGSRPVVLARSTRCDTVACPKGQETYALLLGGTLPPLQSGEVDAAGGRCPGR